MLKINFTCQLSKELNTRTWTEYVTKIAFPTIITAEWLDKQGNSCKTCQVLETNFCSHFYSTMKKLIACSVGTSISMTAGWLMKETGMLNKEYAP